MERMGCYIVGLYTEHDKFVSKDTGEARFRVTVATGRYSYSVYLSEDADLTLLEELRLGQIIKMKARPYSGKNGLAWSDGEIVDIGDE